MKTLFWMAVILITVHFLLLWLKVIISIITEDPQKSAERAGKVLATHILPLAWSLLGIGVAAKIIFH